MVDLKRLESPWVPSLRSVFILKKKLFFRPVISKKFRKSFIEHIQSIFKRMFNIPPMGRERGESTPRFTQMQDIINFTNRVNSPIIPPPDSIENETQNDIPSDPQSDDEHYVRRK